MLDADLAALYGVETRRLNEQVRRNSERFPEYFMFQLTAEELAKAMLIKSVRGECFPFVPSIHHAARGTQDERKTKFRGTQNVSNRSCYLFSIALT
jgi:hypothetical protein